MRRTSQGKARNMGISVSFLAKNWTCWKSHVPFLSLFSQLENGHNNLYSWNCCENLRHEWKRACLNCISILSPHVVLATYIIPSFITQSVIVWIESVNKESFLKANIYVLRRRWGMPYSAAFITLHSTL